MDKSRGMDYGVRRFCYQWLSWRNGLIWSGGGKKLEWNRLEGILGVEGSDIGNLGS